MIFNWLKKLFQPRSGEPAGEHVATVTHYFSKPRVAVLKVGKGKIAVGDTVAFRGHTTNFTQKIESLEIDHHKVNEAARGQQVGLLVRARVRPHDKVFKLG
jgi:putative protease